ncbi:hypothetical protein [Actinomadura citrea]|uniref:CPBP family intramembrane metalloprotease n=1 Tax=Actinomadura citrea TaxID=46158 RepID=A0A7Y9GJ10_9ACTN|nr:hypothetical protein [Actinomadura citrea]NYE17417.1 hypothetical protein [Actinomadura citrea]GGU00873.1 hypothetical protein GCM10010177_70050 [Actinomadura citrea]
MKIMTLVCAVLMMIAAVYTARKIDYRVAYRMLKKMRPRHIGTGVAAFGVTVAGVAIFEAPGWDFLTWSWWQSIGGVGNLSLGLTRGTSVAGALVSVAMILTFVIALPILAMMEEVVFRNGAEDQSAGTRIRRALAFGSMHLVVGVPVAAALALSLTGGVFTWVYLRGARRSKSTEPNLRSAHGLLDSSLVHTVHNVVAVIAVAIALSFC